MALDGEVLEVARMLLLEEGDDPELLGRLFRRVMLAVGASRGFLVVREGTRYVERFELNFARDVVSHVERQTSRTLLRRALASRAILHTSNIHDDEELAGRDSLLLLSPASVVVVPLLAGGEAYGALYLERPVDQAFGDDVRGFLEEAARLSGQWLRRQADRAALIERNASLERDLFARNHFEGIVTRDPTMLAVLETVAQVADATVPVLVRGETGTGKELIARALHVNSGRRERPFVTIHCGALSPTVLESELFGHVKGAFTGADRDRAGRIAAADEGTLFLDEIAELAPELQVRLLRCVQYGELQRVGADRVEKVNVRVVAATNRDLAELLDAGRFRQDLYYRLNAVELWLPPLRARRDDVPLLCRHFLRKHWPGKGELPHLPPSVERGLTALPFPGNVRELEHLIERACLLAQTPELDASLFPALAAGAEPPPGPDQGGELTAGSLHRARDAAVAHVERGFIEALLRRHEGNVSRAARAAEMPRSYLQKLIARHRP